MSGVPRGIPGNHMAAQTGPAHMLMKTTTPRPSAGVLLALGRFELLYNRDAERASMFFKACVDNNPWHASGKVL